MAASFERVGDVVCTVGEGPLWSARENAWYWVDIPAKRIWKLDAASGATRFWSTHEMPACLSLTASGGMIAGMETGIFSIVLGEGEGVHASARRLGAPAEIRPGMRFNDGRCDRQGRFWSGTMVMDNPEGKLTGHLYRFSSADGVSAPVVSDLITQNGLAWSPDGCTMYLSDSHASSQLIWAFDYDGETGTPSNRRLFVDLKPYPGRPDGAAIDVDGCYWICGNDAGVIHRFTPEGKLDRTIEVPMAKPSMCAFGGANMDQLLVASIAAGAPAGDALAGAVVIVNPGVQGFPETAFRD
ncbi:MAG: SMP-30/gluconolactonase/LRE family protein [Gammaproteobacteria bacterium]